MIKRIFIVIGGIAFILFAMAASQNFSWLKGDFTRNLIGVLSCIGIGLIGVVCVWLLYIIFNYIKDGKLKIK
jgi:uncharacterized membrane protein